LTVASSVPDAETDAEDATENTHHPTAEQIHGLVKERMPDISLATVYNTLHELTDMEELCQASIWATGYDATKSRGGTTLSPSLGLPGVRTD
jgi:hypothetical protein